MTKMNKEVTEGVVHLAQDYGEEGHLCVFPCLYLDGDMSLKRQLSTQKDVRYTALSRHVWHPASAVRWRG